MREQMRRWLPAALLALSASGGLSARAHPASASSPAAGHAQARVGHGVAVQETRQADGLAALVRRVRAAAGAGPALDAMVPLSGTAWTQQAELTSTAQTPNDAYGWSVALSGNTAVIGASGTPYYSAYGAVYIFTRTASGVWSQQAELLDPQYGQGHSDMFGTAVALQGNLLVVGTPNATGPVSYTGAAYVYVRAGSAWRLQATLIASDAAYNNGFGSAVALSGNTILVGAPGKNNGEGAIYVFVYTGQGWVQQAEVVYPGRYLFAQFGSRVALWGNTALVAAIGAPVVFVYTRNGATWALQAVLSAPHSPQLYFGQAIALWGDTALVSAYNFYTQINGAVYIFTRSGTSWNLQTTLTPPGGADSTFGTAAALSYQTAVVGGAEASVFVGSGATWTLQAQLMPSDRPPTALGAVLALQGNTVVAGAPNVMGSAYVFVRSGADWAASAGMLGTPDAPLTVRWTGRPATVPAVPWRR